MALSTLTEIPLIDFEPFILGGLEAQQEIGEQIYRACHEIGFLYLKHHGIPQSLIEQAFEQSKQFFNLPLDVKQRYAWTDVDDNRGYIGIGTEKLESKRPTDLKESFQIRQEFCPKDQKKGILKSLNKWVEDKPDFRQTMLEFYDACDQCAIRVLQAFALALGLPKQFFAEKHGQNYTLRLLHYPPLPSTVKPEQVRAGAHSDFGSCTLLFQDDAGGLEILGADGNWIAAPCIPNTVLVNIGDLMQRWTNHEFCSTVHRVINPTGSRSRQSRYSIAFFCIPELDTEVACIESYRNPHRPALYSPILAGDYVLGRRVEVLGSFKEEPTKP